MAPTNIDKSVPAQDGVTPALLAETERIATALEPQLREVIDTTMRRVAEVERQTLEEARHATAATEQASRDALERSSRLVEDLETLTGTVGEVTSRLRAEFDEVTRSLRELGKAEVNGAAPVPEQGIGPGPELSQMFRGHIVEMRNDGKSRDEAERVLKRFKHGRHFLGLLDDVYPSAPALATRRRRGLLGRLRRGA